MKERIPRKLKKGLHSLLYRRDTKWKRKAERIAQRSVQGVAIRFAMGKDEQEPLRDILQQPIPETHHVTINLDEMPMAEKLKLLRR